MRIRFALQGGGFDGELYANPVATDFASRLPVELTFSDFNRVEKVARLDRPLLLEGVPDSDEPSPGEIGYYAPSRGVVLYYGHVGRWPGLVRIGRFDYDLDALRGLPDGTAVGIDRREAAD